MKISSEKGDPLDVISGSHVPRYVLLDMLCVVVDAEAAALKSGNLSSHRAVRSVNLGSRSVELSSNFEFQGIVVEGQPLLLLAAGCPATYTRRRRPVDS